MKSVDLSFASRVLDDCLNLRAQQRVWIDSWDHTLDLAGDIGWECLRRECSLLFTIKKEDLWLRSILEGPSAQLESIPPHVRSALEETNVYIFTLGPRKPVSWATIPEKRRMAVSIWLDTRYDRTNYAEEWARIARARRVKMLAIEATLATPERASAQSLNYEKWRRVMLNGCLADPREMSRRGKALANVLSGSEAVGVTTPAGTGITMKLDKRPVEISDGIATDEGAEKGRVTFLPAGSVEVSVDEESANGTVVYDTPTRRGIEVVERLKVQFKDGRVVEHDASRGDSVFARYLQEDGQTNKIAFIGFGLNPHLRFGYTQDDKVLGGVTFGLGDNERKGGKNRAKSEWWAAVSESTVTVGAQIVVKNGTLLI